MASPTVIGTNATSTPLAGVDASFTITVPSTGQNRALIVLVIASANLVPTGMTATKDGADTAMTKLVDNNPAQQVSYNSVWYLANPDTGTNTVKSSGIGLGNTGAYLAFTLQDCAQSSPLDQSASSSGSGTSNTVTMTAPASDSLSILFTGQGTLATSITPGTGQTELQAPFTSTGVFQMSSSYEVAEATMTSSWTTSVTHDETAFAIKYLAPSTTTSSSSSSSTTSSSTSTSSSTTSSSTTTTSTSTSTSTSTTTSSTTSTTSSTTSTTSSSSTSTTTSSTTSTTSTTSSTTSTSSSTTTSNSSSSSSTTTSTTSTTSSTTSTTSTTSSTTSTTSTTSSTTSTTSTTSSTTSTSSTSTSTSSSTSSTTTQLIHIKPELEIVPIIPILELRNDIPVLEIQMHKTY